MSDYMWCTRDFSKPFVQFVGFFFWERASYALHRCFHLFEQRGGLIGCNAEATKDPNLLGHALQRVRDNFLPMKWMHKLKHFRDIWDIIWTNFFVANHQSAALWAVLIYNDFQYKLWTLQVTSCSLSEMVSSHFCRSFYNWSHSVCVKVCFDLDNYY